MTARSPLTSAEAEKLAECELVIAQRYGPPGSRASRSGVKRADRRQHDVYVHLAANGAVLYVGISLSVVTRTAAHRSSAWWREVATIRVEHLPDRASALAREAELIAELRPMNNVNGAA